MFLGVDEAGRGPVLGPLVVAGLVAEDEDSLKAMGVKDSKMLSAGRREELFSVLSRDHYHCILELPARSIDLTRDLMTMNQLEVICFASVIASLHRGEVVIHPLLKGEVRSELGGKSSAIDRVILDAADVNADRFGDEVLEETHHLEDIGGIGFLSLHKADRDHPVVGAASILAKVVRDRNIHRLSDDVGKPIGSGYPSDPVTVSFLKDHLDEKGELPAFARRSWETSKKMVGDRNQRSLLDY
jgi:ribonuclease HII